MSERARMAASSAAWIASSAMAEFLMSLEETDLSQRQRQETTHLALRAFDGVERKITESLSLEEFLKDLGANGGS
jgi:hypothetical protein